jgi:hypothetical protein
MGFAQPVFHEWQPRCSKTWPPVIIRTVYIVVALPRFSTATTTSAARRPLSDPHVLDHDRPIDALGSRAIFELFDAFRGLTDGL